MKRLINESVTLVIAVAIVTIFVHNSLASWGASAAFAGASVAGVTTFIFGFRRRVHEARERRQLIREYRRLGLTTLRDNE